MQIRYGIAVSPGLDPDVDLLTGLAIACADIAMVVKQDGEPRGL